MSRMSRLIFAQSRLALSIKWEEVMPMTGLHIAVMHSLRQPGQSWAREYMRNEVILMHEFGNLGLRSYTSGAYPGSGVLRFLEAGSAGIFRLRTACK